MKLNTNRHGGYEGRKENEVHRIYFYKDKSGKRPVADYLMELAGKKDKDSRIKLNKIRDYVKALSHIDGDIWELRPIRDRIFFVAWTGGSFVLLHQFMKKTQKTPAREIERAKREFEDLKERGIVEDEYE